MQLPKKFKIPLIGSLGPYALAACWSTLVQSEFLSASRLQDYFVALLQYLHNCQAPWPLSFSSLLTYTPQTWPRFAAPWAFRRHCSVFTEVQPGLLLMGSEWCKLVQSIGSLMQQLVQVCGASLAGSLLMRVGFVCRQHDGAN